MGVLKHKKEWPPTQLERSIERLAHRRATTQLLLVPWNRFRKAYVAYPRWLALTLWTQAILGSEAQTPRWLVADLTRRCRGSIDDATLQVERGLLVLRVQEWIHNRVFRKAKEEGWLDALIFFGTRATRSRAAWAYWEHCESEWSRQQPRAYPSFEEWWKMAQRYEFCERATARQIAGAVERYVEWHAIASWLDSVWQANEGLAPQVVAELGRRCPDLLQFCHARQLENHHKMGKFQQFLTTWIENHCFAEARSEGWFTVVTRQACDDPRYVRLREFSKRRPHASGSRKVAGGWLRFEQWQREAEDYVGT